MTGSGCLSACPSSRQALHQAAKDGQRGRHSCERLWTPRSTAPLPGTRCQTTEVSKLHDVNAAMRSSLARRCRVFLFVCLFVSVFHIPAHAGLCHWETLEDIQARVSVRHTVDTCPPQARWPLEGPSSKIIKLGITPTEQIWCEDLMAQPKVWHRHY